jgi:retinol dehydrogenase 14
MADIAAGPMAGKTVLVTGGTSGIGRATAAGLAGFGARVGITRRDPDRTPNRRRRHRRRLRQSSRRRVPGRHVRPAGGTPAGPRRAERLPTTGRVDQQRGWVLVYPPGHRRWAGTHLRRQPPGRVPAHRSAARAAHRQRSGPDRHGVVRRPGHGTYPLRRSAGRTWVLRPAGLQPVEAGQRCVHLRVGPPPGRHRGDRHRAAPRRGPHPIRRRRSFTTVDDPAAPDPAVAEVPAKGAATSIYLASSPDVEGVTGTYFVNRKPRTSSRISYDQAAAAHLWQISVELVQRRAGAEPVC